MGAAKLNNFQEIPNKNTDVGVAFWGYPQSGENQKKISSAPGRKNHYRHGRCKIPTWTLFLALDIPTWTLQNTDMGVANFRGTTDMDVAKYRHGSYFLSHNSLIINGQIPTKEKYVCTKRTSSWKPGSRPVAGGDDVFLFLRKGGPHG
ncbi:MAG: hypothetical protein EOP86_07265 [Verrucomicrobiaceae bacterium]|nr:MAG: hypothetical protein EOP86_07265 [Verrucomicrobiaceae bacterium]